MPAPTAAVLERFAPSSLVAGGEAAVAAVVAAGLDTYRSSEE